MAVPGGVPMWVAPLNALSMALTSIFRSDFHDQPGTRISFLVMLHVFARRQAASMATISAICADGPGYQWPRYVASTPRQSRCL